MGFGAIRLDRFSPNFDRAGELGITNVRPDRNYRFIYDLDEPELFNLAYYFQHDYADGRDPETYVAEAFEAFRRWQTEPAGRGLIYVDHGEALAIWDLRSRAKRTLIILSGIEREVYLYCEENRGLPQIEGLAAAHASSVASVRQVLEELVADQLMLHVDGRYLSLAVRSVRKGSEADAETAVEQTNAWPTELAVL